MRYKPVTVTFLFTGLALAAAAYAQNSTRVLGSLTAVSGHTLTIKPDNGAPSTVTVSDTARVLRTQPGAKTLAGATPIAITDLTAGDRVLAVVNSGAATLVIDMKQTDIAEQRAAEAAAWRSGAGGLVKTVDPSTGDITIASGARSLTIHVTPKTIIRRYSPNSNQFADAKPSTLAEVHPGDQLRVRGSRSTDGAEITADAMIAGAFRNIAGVVLSTNSAENTVTVNDLVTKKPVVIRITAESQLHKLPQAMAESLAARFKHRGGEQHETAAQQAGWKQNGGEGGPRGGDLSQMLEHTPVITLSGLHKGDAVMIVATQGTPESATAVTLLAGVEPILSASPSGDESMFSASWNLGGGGAGTEAEGQQ